MYLNKYDLSGSTAFITGGGRGIGFATAEALLDAGARVIIADRDANLLEHAKAHTADKGRRIEMIELDIAKPGDVAAAAQECNQRFGAVDILVANAGITQPDTAGENISDEAWRHILEVNLNGTFWCCREFAKPMLERGRGAIVTLGSISGLISNNPQRQAHYNVSKAGVHHLTKSLAGEWAERGVRVNGVAPTYVDTPMSNSSFTDPERFPIWMSFTPMKRVARPDEIASAILFLASDASSAVTGVTLPVDCGYTIW
ncbi:MAG: SDR family oxidoreductase [Methylobacterium mesophilicum]|nr:SDR family oxidoreductase [Methylobacterium mesophilicum]